jgi:hypothetical protein
MKPQDFCFWLQGLLEVGAPQELTQKQLDVIKEHLELALDERKDVSQLIANVRTTMSC